jgi:hypothetical protein
VYFLFGFSPKKTIKPKECLTWTGHRTDIFHKTRECACASIANLVANPANIGLILQNDCIKILAPLFVDKSPQVFTADERSV